MEDQNTGADEKQPTPTNSKPKVDMAIVAYNLLGLAAYTILFRLLASAGGMIFDMLVLAGHVLVCFVMSIVNKSWMWVLSGVLVLVIGFSTCVTVIGGM
jgi:uncharacterized membrane protein